MSKRAVCRDGDEDTKLLERAGARASAKAVRHAKALGLTIAFIKNGAVYEEYPDGTLLFKKNIDRKKPPFKLVKGMVLYAK